MATAVTVRLDTSEIKSMVSRLNAGKASHAIARGLNDSIRIGRTEAIKQVTGRYNIKRFEITRNNSMKVDAARRGDLESKLFVSLRSMPVSSFKGVTGDLQRIMRTRVKGSSDVRTQVIRGKQKFQNIKRSKPRQKVSVTIVKGQKVTFNHAFLAKVKAGESGFHIGVFNRAYNSKGYVGGKFKRRSGKRLKGNFPEPDNPIAQLYSFSIHKSMSNRFTEKGVITKMQDAVPRRVTIHLQRELKIGPFATNR